MLSTMINVVAVAPSRREHICEVNFVRIRRLWVGLRKSRRSSERLSSDWGNIRDICCVWRAGFVEDSEVEKARRG